MQSVGSIWTVQVLALPAACQTFCDEGCWFQTHLKLRNECEILKNEIYSVKSELKVITIYFLRKLWAPVVRAFLERRGFENLCSNFEPYSIQFFPYVFSKVFKYFFYELHVIFSLSMIIFGSRLGSYWVWFSLFRRA